MIIDDTTLYTNFMQITDMDGNIIPWSVNFFPDKQVQFKMLKADYPDDDNVNVKVSLCDSIMVDLFFQMASILNIENLTINYLYGARSDKYESGDWYVANVANIMLNQIYSTANNVTILAPHCEIRSTYSFNSDFDIPSELDLTQYDMVIFPDESAKERFTNVTVDSIVCEKHRDQESGKIISHKIPQLPDWVKKVILLDDLVDAGGSPLGVIASCPADVQADLFVFHGVLSNNALTRLLKKFERIICTNSLPYPQEQKDDLVDIDPDRVLILNVW